MDNQEQSIAPAEDLAFLDTVADIALSTYGANGGLPLFGMIDAGTMPLIIPADDTSPAGKHMFVNLMRFLSIDNQGRRSALAFEAWSVFDRTEESQRISAEIRARGGSISEHPDVEEGICILLESDAGGLQRMNRIVRNGNVVTLEPGEAQFSPAGTRPLIGTMVAFHVPEALRSDPAVAAFADDMRAMVGVDYQPIELTGKPAN